jgi:hypothetical protein
MDIYGINNVRGGSFVSVKLKKSTIDTLKRMSNGTGNKCFICGKGGHFANNCQDYEDDDDEDENEDDDEDDEDEDEDEDDDEEDEEDEDEDEDEDDEDEEDEEDDDEDEY